MADLKRLNVGERIKALRGQRQWSAQALANACADLGAYTLTRSTIAKVEANLRRLQTDEAVVLARIFGVSVEELLGAAGGAASRGAAGGGVAGDNVAGGGVAGGNAGRAGDQGVLLAGSDAWFRSIIEQDPAEQEIGRAREVHALLEGLNDTRGPHSWLVIGPPGMGKSTLLSQLARVVAKDSRWAARRVDARDLAPEEREDAETVLARMLGEEAPVSDETATYLGIAKRISREGKRLLCLLDSAELLPNSTATRVRSVLGSVYRFVQETRNPAVWLTFVVASRRDDGWRSVTPIPRLTLLPLAEFGADVIEKRLRGSAQARAAQYSPAQFAVFTSIVHTLTAGWPPLLEPFLTWIRDEEWLAVERLEDREVFDSLAGPDIEDWLLARDSLLPESETATKRQFSLVRDAIQLLVRFRFFTQSHVQHFVEHDSAFRENLERSGWKTEDLWMALSRTTLLARPLDEPWQEFHPAIRRLLFRYFYPTAQQRAAADEQAREFVNTWAARQRGKDQVAGLVEGLWHHAAALGALGSADARAKLVGNARELADELRPSESYTVSDLRSYAVERIIADAELQESISGDRGLADQLIHELATGARE